MSDRMTRRDMMKRSLLVLGATAGAGAVLAGCGDDGDAGGGSDLSCTDTSGLTEAEKQLRQQQEYTDSTPYPDKRCDNCQLYQAPQEEGTCGGCQVMKGPIHPAGYCKLWVAKS